MPFYWEHCPDGPFVTLIAVATTYLDPENYNLDVLKGLAERDDDDEMRVFKSELRAALRDPSRLPGDELFESVEYGNGGDEAFLVWLWHELYGDEPFGASVLTRLRALPEPFADRLHWRAKHAIRATARAGESDKALQMLLVGLADGNVPVTPAEYGELAALLSAIGQPAGAITGLSVGAGNSPAPAAESAAPSSRADA